MAITATISLSPTTVNVNTPTVATLTVSNSGGSAVNVTSVTPDARLTGGLYSVPPGVAFGLVPLGPGAPVSVAASGSLVLTFPVIFFAPSGSLSLSGGVVVASTTYDVAATIYTSDGAITAPTAATVTVNPIPVSPSQFP